MVEPLPPIQLEACGIFLLVQRVVVLHTLPVSGVQVVLPVLKGGVRLAYLSRAERASVPSSPYPIMLAPFVLLQVSSLHLFPPLWARYLLLLVRSLSRHPAALGWLAVRSTRSNELISMSSSPCRLPGESILTRRPALPLAAPERVPPTWLAPGLDQGPSSLLPRGTSFGRSVQPRPPYFRPGRRTGLSARGRVPPIPEVPGCVLTPDSSKRLHIHAVPSSSMPAQPTLDTPPDDPRALLRAAFPVSDA